MKFKYLFILALMIFLEACGAYGKRFTNLDLVEDKKGVLYIYRPTRLLHGGTWPTINIDGQKVGSLKNGGYLVKEISPGKHVVEITGNIFIGGWMHRSFEVPIDIDAGEYSFLRIWLGGAELHGTPGMYSVLADVHVKEVPKEVALKELSEVRLSD